MLCAGLWTVSHSAVFLWTRPVQCVANMKSSCPKSKSFVIDTHIHTHTTLLILILKMSSESLDRYERARVADVLREKEFNDGDYVITQGERGDMFYIIVEVGYTYTHNVGDC